MSDTTGLPEPDENGGIDIEGMEHLQPDLTVGEGHDIELFEELQKAKPAPPAPEFYANLAETMDATELADIATRCIELYDIDKQARQKRDERQKRAMQSSGIADNGGPQAGDSAFEGASVVTHPMLLKSAIQLSTNLTSELLPANGPVKSSPIGSADRAKMEKADRKVRHMNWQCTDQIEEFYDEVETALSQVPYDDQFIKVWQDTASKRPRVEYVPGDRVFVPYDCGYFYGSPRIWIDQQLPIATVERRMENGVYRTVDLTAAGTNGADETASQQQADRIAGKERPAANEDGVRPVIWGSVIDDFEGDGDAPYLIEIDEINREVLSIHRNWEEDDETQRRFDWLVKFSMLPGRDAYGLSLYDLVGSLSTAATGALRALLDSALVNTTPSLIKLKGLNFSGQTQQLELCGVTELEGAVGDDPDIRKMMMAIPFNQPSPTLFQLLAFLTQQGESLVRTALDDSAVDASTPVPVGTQLSRVEQGLKVYKQIHARAHRAMGRLLSIQHRLNGLYLDEKQLVRDAGEILAKLSDYQGPIDVRPVSDPDIFSEQQRAAQAQVVSQRATALPQLYDLRKVEERILSSLKVPNYEELLAKDGQVQEQNAATENLLGSMGQHIAVYPEQDHLAHIQTHVDFMQSPVLGANPLIAPKYLPVILPHIGEHLAMWYLSHAYKLVSDTAGKPLEELLDPTDEAVKALVDQAMASASPIIVQQASALFQNLGPIIQQAQQMLQKMMPPPPMDPSQVQAQAVQAQSQANAARNQIEQGKLALDQQRLSQDAQDHQSDQQTDVALGQAKLAQSADATQQNNATKLQMNTEDNRTAMTLAAAEIASADNVSVSTGHGLNPNP